MTALNYIACSAILVILVMFSVMLTTPVSNGAF